MSLFRSRDVSDWLQRHDEKNYICQASRREKREGGKKCRVSFVTLLMGM